MTETLSINCSHIRERLIVSIGKEKLGYKNEINFPNISTLLINEFLEEHKLNNCYEENKLSGKLTITRENSSYLIEGEIVFEPLLECVRSLTLFREKIVANFYGIFKEESKLIHKDMLELEDSDLDTYYYKGNSLQLDEFILDNLVHSLPELPLCCPECKGLCCDCGANLNTSTACERKANTLTEIEPCRYFI